ncbi:hypothetical protein TWF718_008235 [Orbilia javanica]|uniref:Uncharacterized protein n=1 Tax=Orbilia javanica TaxID=47235 RepID=A0AAN8RCY5_9PEZI
MMLLAVIMEDIVPLVNGAVEISVDRVGMIAGGALLLTNSSFALSPNGVVRTVGAVDPVAAKQKTTIAVAGPSTAVRNISARMASVAETYFLVLLGAVNTAGDVSMANVFLLKASNSVLMPVVAAPAPTETAAAGILPLSVYISARILNAVEMTNVVLQVRNA